MFHVKITFTQEWLAADYQLYNHFLKILEKEVKRLESNTLEMIFHRILTVMGKKLSLKMLTSFDV